jgi:hypothetical protein
MRDNTLEGMLTIKMMVTLPTTTPRRKRVVLAKSWCKRDDASDELGKWLSANKHVNAESLTVEWIAQEIVFFGLES